MGLKETWMTFFYFQKSMLNDKIKKNKAQNKRERLAM
jgi:hypothetical protein